MSQLKKYGKWIVLVAILVAITAFVYHAYQNNQLTKGNTRDEIIRSLENLENQPLDHFLVTDILDVENVRYVALTQEDLIGIAEFVLDDQNDYRFRYVEWYEEDVTVYSSFIRRENYGSVHTLVGYENGETEVESVGFKVNEEMLEQTLTFEPYQLTALVVEEGISGSYTMEYHYFNSDGEQIK